MASPTRGAREAAVPLRVCGCPTVGAMERGGSERADAMELVIQHNGAKRQNRGDEVRVSSDAHRKGRF